jgi:hypothetical protein
MKTLYLTSNSNIIIDAENNSVDKIDSERECISRIYMANEPTHVIFGEGEFKKEFDVKKDDIIITFYACGVDWPNRVVVAKSKDWVANFKANRKAEQKAKEEWAKNKADLEKCCGDCDQTAIPAC